MPAASTLEGFPQLEGLIVSMADRDSGRRTHRGLATRAVRLSGITACSVWSAFQPILAARGVGVWVLAHTCGCHVIGVWNASGAC